MGDRAQEAVHIQHRDPVVAVLLAIHGDPEGVGSLRCLTDLFSGMATGAGCPGNTDSGVWA